jgi:hypothetical protein
LKGFLPLSPPFIQDRQLYLDERFPDHDFTKGYPTFILFYWINDSLQFRGFNTSSDGKLPLIQIIPNLMGIASYQLKGNEEILNYRLAGDFIIRDSIAVEERVVSLQKIINADMDLSANLVSKEKELDSYIIKNMDSSLQLPDSIAIDFKTDFDSQNIGSGVGVYLESFLSAMANYMGKPVLCDLPYNDKDFPKWGITFHNYPSKNEEVSKQFISIVSEKTGFKFEETKVKKNVLFVE